VFAAALAPRVPWPFSTVDPGLATLNSFVIIAEIFEAGMLVCFGFAWPVDVVRTLRVRRTWGKSIGFMTLILVGYLFGMTAKVMRAWGAWPEAVTALYAFNAVMVATDIAVTLYFRRRGV